MRGDRASNTLRIANDGNEADDCYIAKENGSVLFSLGLAIEVRSVIVCHKMRFIPESMMIFRRKNFGFSRKAGKGQQFQ